MTQLFATPKALTPVSTFEVNFAKKKKKSEQPADRNNEVRQPSGQETTRTLCPSALEPPNSYKTSADVCATRLTWLSCAQCAGRSTCASTTHGRHNPLFSPSTSSEILLSSTLRRTRVDCAEEEARGVERRGCGEDGVGQQQLDRTETLWRERKSLQDAGRTTVEVYNPNGVRLSPP